MSDTALAIIETTAAVQLFTPGFLDPIVGRVEKEAREEAAKLDISTAAGRKAIASLSFKVAKSKTFIDSKRKELVQDEKKRLAAIDAEGRAVWNRLEALQDEVRKPLTDWEEADKIRVAGLEFKVESVQHLAVVPFGSTTEQIKDRLAELQSMEKYSGSMQEFTSRFDLAYKTAYDAIVSAHTQAEQRDAEKAENERLRKEAADREHKERDERIAKEAREKAQREAEEERQRIEKEKFEAEARAKQAEAEKLAAQERAERAAKEAAELAESNRVAAEKRAKEEAEAAAKRHAEELAQAEQRRHKAEEEASRQVQESAARHQREKEAAIEAERERVAAEKRKEDAETAAREANKKHRAAINSAAVNAMVLHCQVTEETAKLIITAIVMGNVPSVKVSY